jgi:hypothetical protein
MYITDEGNTDWVTFIADYRHDVFIDFILNLVLECEHSEGTCKDRCGGIMTRK